MPPSLGCAAIRALGGLGAALATSLGGTAAEAQQNLSFESVGAGAPSGWSVQRADEVGAIGAIAVDATVAASGARSLRITHRHGDDFLRVGQAVAAAAVARGPAAAPRRVRVSAAVRGPASRDSEAALWLRVSGGKGVLFVDSRGDGREPLGGGAERPVPRSAPAGELAPPGTRGTAVRSPAERAPSEWIRREIELPLPDDAAEVVFGASLRGAGSAWFDDFAVHVVPVEGPAPSATAMRYVEAALDIVQRHSLNPGAADWATLRRATLEHARGAVSTADTYPALRFALRELGDRHSYLLAPGPAAALLVAPVSNARTGRAAVEPIAQTRAGRFAYLSVPGFAGGTPSDQARFAADLQARIASLDTSDTCGWILDLRRNTGGNLWPMLAGAGPLLGDGELAASVYPDGSRRAIWYEHGRAGFGDYVQLRVASPYTLRAPDAPLAVLIGGRTASSAEVLVAALRGRERTRTFGAPTRGLSAGNRTFELADHAALVLTVAATSDRAGRIDLGPITPDEPVDGRGGVAGEAPRDAPRADPVAAAALAWLETQEPCR
jgi:carboxyl-terminal processing protease